MKKYTYNSSIPCHITLHIGTSAKEVSMFQGENYELPEEDPIVKRMLCQGLLTEITENPQLSKTQLKKIP
jgi:hypothetical protein